jgi:hypothetical protein
MQSIHIGLLLPSSTILPIGKDFEKGLKQAFSNISKEEYEIEITKEFVGQGASAAVENAVNKFLNYDTVDLVTGILSNKVVENIAAKFNSKHTPFLVNNLGEHVPNLAQFNSHIFINSKHLWRHAWALGNWGVKAFGKKGMYLSAVYDAGYSFSQMFHLGMMNADPTSEWSFSVLPMPPTGQPSDMEHLFPFLEQYQPDFVFATFCGTETTVFLNEFISRGWHKRTKLLGLPYLLFPFETLTDDITVYTTSINSVEADNDIAKTFYQLGYQTGNTIAEALVSDGANLKEKLLNAKDLISFNELIFLNYNQTQNDSVTILKNDILVGEKQIKQSLIEATPLFPITPDALQDLTKEISVAWLNPYLCI